MKIENSSRLELGAITNGNLQEFHSELRPVMSRYGVQTLDYAFPNLDDRTLNRIYHLEFSKPTDVDQFMSELEQFKYIEYAERVPIYTTQIVPNDPGLTNQWYMGPTYMNAYDAFDKTFGNSNVKLAIVDDAVLISHQDLTNVIWTNPGEIPNNNIDDDNNGYIDDVNGWDAADNDNNPNPPAAASNTTFTHGTHCAGIAGAQTNNSTGVASLGSGVSIIPVKCTDDTNLSPSLNNTYGGMQYAIAVGADVISMSFGGTGFSNTVQSLINVGASQGIIFVAAAGNSNVNTLFYPAAYNNVISVASTTTGDDKSSFSNYGTWIDISAPGSSIYSTLAGSNSSYGYQSGTSMACPNVAGLCALILSYNPTLTPAQVENCIITTADNIDAANPSYIGQLGGGRIDADAAMVCANPNVAPIADFTADLTTICFGGSIQFSDASTLGPTSWSWSFPGGTPSTSSQQNPTITYNSAGTYAVTLTASNAYGNDSETKTGYITVTSGGQALPFIEDFESGSFATNSWTIDNPDNDETWKLETVAGTNPGNTAALMEFYYYNNATGERDGIQTPPLDFTGLTSAQLTFEYAYRRYNTSSSDSLIVYLSTDCGVTFPHRLLAKGEDGTGSFATQTTSTTAFTAGVGDWCTGTIGADCDTVDLLAFIGSNNVVIKFEGYNNYGNNLFLDNINISGTTVPLKPVADFTANNTTIVQGGSVNFTDLSLRTPTNWDWTFAGAATGTSTNQNPSSITYNTVGSYDVTLIASNGVGADTITKPNYINVVSPSGTGQCDTATNFTGSIQFYTVTGGQGYVCGHNVYGDQAKADYFNYNGQATTIDGAFFGFAYASFSNPATSIVRAHVWDGTGGTPGASLGNTSILISNIATDVTNGDLTYVSFSPPITMPASGEFFLGIELIYGAGDTVALFSNTDGDSNPGTAWEQFSNNSWFPMSDAVNTWGLDISLVTYPVMCGISADPVADFVANRRFLYAGNTLDLFDLTTGNPISWDWDIPGSNSPSSTAQDPSNISYNTAGSYDVTLIANNIFGADTITKTNYIEVVDLQSGCDTLSTIGATDTLRFYRSTGGGYVCGHNTRGDLAKAESFNIYPPGSELTGAILLFGEAVYSSPSSTIDVSVWDNSGANGSPGTRIATQTITIQSIAQDIANGDFTAVTFSNPATINGPFFIGIEMTYSNGDSVGLVSNTIGESIPPSAWEKQSNGDWNRFDDPNTWNGGIGISQVILPILCISNYSADFEADTTTVCAGSFIQFTDLSTQGSNSWSWSFPGGLPSSSNLRNPQILYGAQGTYDVTLVVSNGVSNDSITMTNYITVNGAPGINFDVDNISCNGLTDGSITVNPAGGQSPYSYNWSPSGSGNNISSLSAGSYSVTVTDANGCSDNGSVNITEPDTISIQFSSTDVSCNGGSDGSINMNVTGGSYPYRYSTDGVNFNSQNPVTGLSAGNYTVVVKDTNDCTNFRVITISEPTALSVSLSVSNANCGVNDGSATATPSGGTPPYSYLWSSGGTGSTANNLGAGSYNVTITDANNCTVVGVAAVSNIGAPTIGSNITNVDCYGGSNGAITLNISGGQMPYSTVWSTGGSGTSRNNLVAGIYNVTVTDGATCISTASFTVTEPDSIDIDLDITEPSCSNSNGSIRAIVTGGTPTYSYNWSGISGNVPQINNLGPNQYSVTVTDANGCTNSASALLTNQPGPLGQINVNDETCSGSNDGSISTVVTGGTAPISYFWSTGATSSGITNLGSGPYSVTITDANGCQVVLNGTVNSGVTLSINSTVTPASSSFSNNGTATATASGGAAPYSYSWSTGANGSSISNLGVGTYTVTATDQNGCNITDTVYINATSINDLSTLLGFDVYPNPASSSLNVELTLGGQTEVEIYMSNLLGQTVSEVQIYNTSEVKTIFDLSGLADGVYLLHVQSANYHQQVKVIKSE